VTAGDLNTTRGYSFPELDFLREQSPAYDAARQRLLSFIYTPTDPVLATKDREIIASAILAVRAYPSIESHLRRALREGATVREIIEAMGVAALPGGGPTQAFAMGFLGRIAAEQGLEADPENETLGGPPDRLDAERGYGFEVFDWMRRHTPDYDDARRSFLGFLYTPVDPVLPVKMREIITAAVLAFRGYPTIDVHFRRALREGATLRELIEAMQVAAVPGGSPTLHFALTHLKRVVEEDGLDQDAALVPRPPTGVRQADAG
jgi:alkylhydroperoxidase/carboxymuconolactone decarboxylase family protein YurZ